MEERCRLVYVRIRAQEHHTRQVDGRKGLEVVHPHAEAHEIYIKGAGVCHRDYKPNIAARATDGGHVHGELDHGVKLLVVQLPVEDLGGHLPRHRRNISGASAGI